MSAGAAKRLAEPRNHRQFRVISGRRHIAVAGCVRHSYIGSGKPHILWVPGSDGDTSRSNTNERKPAPN